MDVLSLDELKDMVPEIKSQMNRIIDTAFHLGQQPPQARIDRAVEVLTAAYGMDYGSWETHLVGSQRKIEGGIEALKILKGGE